LSATLADRSIARVLRVVHHDVTWTEILLDGVVVIELGLFEANCAMLCVVSTVGGDCVDGFECKGDNGKSYTSVMMVSA
jgi:hypothetical protein